MKIKTRLTKDEVYHLTMALSMIVKFLTENPLQQGAVPAFKLDVAKRLLMHFQGYVD